MVRKLCHVRKVIGYCGESLPVQRYIRLNETQINLTANIRKVRYPRHEIESDININNI